MSSSSLDEFDWADKLAPRLANMHVRDLASERARLVQGSLQWFVLLWVEAEAKKVGVYPANFTLGDLFDQWDLRAIVRRAHARRPWFGEESLEELMKP